MEAMRIAMILSLALAWIPMTTAEAHRPAKMEVLIDGAPAREYYHRGTVYLEAIRGKEYAVRITNPTGSRVAVALSVDGLNTIDARHTDARSSRKWVLGPYESTVIRGWQTNAEQARRFFFTTEPKSYGASLGRTENLGTISAVFFREKICQTQQTVLGSQSDSRLQSENVPAAPSAPLRLDSAGSGGESRQKETQSAASKNISDFAATGIGGRIRHEIEWIHMELEDQPFASISMRYEYRPALVKLGVIHPPVSDDPLIRRENAKGFGDALYCPEP